MPGLSSPAVTQFFSRLHAVPTACLMLDYDGTLAPFSTDRARAIPYAGVQALVAEIARSDRTKVVIISGRTAQQVEQLLQLDGHAEYWGSYGAERLDRHGKLTYVELSAEQSAGLAQAVHCLNDLNVPSQQCELKPVGVALHWRALDAATAQRWYNTVTPRWTEIAAASGLEVRPFNEGVEIMPANINKADAVLRVLADNGNSALPAYLGDDASDEDAFSVIPSQGLSILVGEVPRQTNAQVFLRRPQEVLEFLQLWLAELR